MSGDINMLEILVSTELDINPVNKEGDTPLLVAIKNENVKTAKIDAFGHLRRTDPVSYSSQYTVIENVIICKLIRQIFSILKFYDFDYRKKRTRSLLYY